MITHSGGQMYSVRAVLFEGPQVIETVRLHVAGSFDEAMAASESIITANGQDEAEILQCFLLSDALDLVDFQPPEVPLDALDGAVVFHKTYPAPDGDREVFLWSHFKGRDFDE